MNVIAAASRRKEITYMKTFTIDADNNITVHASRKAARETGVPAFTNESELAELIGADNKRLVEIWNSLAGVKPVAKFANRKVAAERIWKAIQSLGETSEAPQVEEPAYTPGPAPVSKAEESVAEPEATLEPAPVIVEATNEPAQPEAEAQPEMVPPVEPAATVGAQAADVAPAKAKATKKAPREKKAPKTKAVVKDGEAAGPREGSKTAQVVAMLKREGGATLEEIMSTMGWQKHTVRGFMAGAMKKAGYTVESFKPEGGARTYRINS
jgi:Protein of unknown function (DUF3489)